MKRIFILILLITFSCGSNKSKNNEDATQQDTVSYDTIYYEDSKSIEYIEEDIIVEKSLQIPQPINSVIDEYDIVEEEVGEDETFNLVIVPQTQLGRLVYEIPDEMTKFNVYYIIAKIQRDTVDVRIYNGIKVVVDTIIRVSETMQVELIDPSGINFNIVSNSAQQFVEITEPTTWEFSVTPLKSGENPLQLVVSVIRDGNLKQTVYKDNVIVKTSAGIEIKSWFGKYWQWFFTVLLIPIFKWMWNKRKEKL